MIFSIQMTHSSFFSSVAADEPGRAAPHERQTTREPKFVSGHELHFQSPGFRCIAAGGRTSVSIGSLFARPHLLQAVRAAKFVFLHDRQIQSPARGTI